MSRVARASTLSAVILGCLSLSAGQALAARLGAQAVACPSTKLCVAVGPGSSVLSSTDPTGGAAAWNAGKIPGIGSLVSITCPSASLCLTTDGHKLAYSTNPAGGPGTWTVQNVFDPNFPVATLGCATVNLCVAFEAETVFTTTSPTGGQGAWGGPYGQQIVFGYWGFQDVVCPSTTECISVGSTGEVWHSTDPAAGGNTWSGAPYTGNPYIDQRTSLNGVSCPSISQCFAVSASGQVVHSTNPAGPPTKSWKATTIDTDINGRVPLEAISCPSVSLCVAVDSNGNVLSSAHPLGASHDWRSSLIGANIGYSNTDFTGISCASTSLCVAVGVNELAASSNPNGGAGAWINLDAGPTVRTGLAKSIHERSAVLSGYVNPHGSPVGNCSFHLSDSYGTNRTLACSRKVGSGGGLVGVSANAGSLQPGRQYSFYLTAGNANGQAQGSIRRFFTVTVSAREVQRALRKTLAASCTHSTLTALVRAGGCKVVFDAPAGGPLMITWTVGAYTYIGGGTSQLAASGRTTLTIALPSTDKRVLRGLPRQVKVKMRGTFSPRSDLNYNTYSVTRTYTFTR